MAPTGQVLQTASATMGVELAGSASEQLAQYVAEIVRWRTQINLTATGNPEEIVRRHLIDSLLPLAAVPISDGQSVIDVGTGAGFPGIPMKIARPDLYVTLLEASRKKVAFLEHVRDALGLARVEIVWGRAEEWAYRAGFREAFDLAVERAAARVAAAAELCLPFVRVGGCALLLKGPRALDELPGAARLVADLGAAVEASDLRTMPVTGYRRVAVVLRKTQATPGAFPRRAVRIGRGG